MLSCAVCDDEPHMLHAVSAGLEAYLKGRGLAYEIFRFGSGKALLNSGRTFDLLLLDVQMGPPDGLETARLMREKGCQGLILFITVLKERVFEAFAVEPWDYLLKPLDGNAFQRALDRAVQRLQEKAGGGIVIPQGNGCEVAPFDQILFCEVYGRKISLHRIDGVRLEFYERLDALEKRLDGRFFRCHRSYLVNLDCVRSCKGGQLTLAGGETLPVSRLRERELMQALLVRMKEGRR